MPLRLRVHGLAGEICAVDAERGWMVRQAKDAVEAASGLPWWEQRLCFGSTELLDDERLGASLRGAGADTGAEGLDVSVFRAHVDRSEWISLVAQKPMQLCEAPPPILADSEVVLAAVTADVWSLAYAAKELRGDLGFALAAVRLNGLALRHLAPEIRILRQVVLEAVQRNGQALKDAGDFQADSEIVMAAMRQDSGALIHASPALLDDRGFVLEAVRVNWRVLRYARKEFCMDQEIAAIASRQGTGADLFLMETRLGACGGEEEPWCDRDDHWSVDDCWISPEDARELQERDKAIFLDCRGSGEFHISHIPGAHCTAADALGSFTRTATFNLVVEQEDRTVIAYSDNGGALSRCVHMVHKLTLVGKVSPERVLRLEGGMNLWKRLGLPVEGDRREMFAGLAVSDLPPESR